jgi:high-affinity iron transporter
VLGTFVIGLREGLEAALVVGILAAFCKRNGASMRPMWFGIVAAVLLSIGVGVTLEIVSASLPQAAQEGMEAVISAVAIVFVTSMIVWMSKHARGLKKELEAAAGDALRDGTAWAMAGMAFLAIVKEGFETSVFLLATFQASTSVTAAVVGAVLGILVAVAIGVGLYHGGIRFNIGRFFQITGVFLVFVAAGLVVSMLRSAHEAGWITIGQGRTIDLAWLAPAGSVRAALITGVLGIPADPRVIEVLFWLCYLVPVLALVLWPAKRRLKGAAAVRLQLGLAGGLAVAALALVVLVPAGSAFHSTQSTPIVAASTAGGTGDATVGDATLTGGALVVTPHDGAPTSLPLAAHPSTRAQHGGVDATETTWTDAGTQASLPAQVSLADLMTYAGGRVPVGMSPQTDTGPFDAHWTQQRVTSVWTAGDDVLLDAQQQTTTTLRITGGGLAGPRTLTVDARALGTTPDWNVDPAHVTAVGAGVVAAQDTRDERALWKIYLPTVLLLAALGFGAAGFLGRRRLTRSLAPTAPTVVPGVPAEPSAVRSGPVAHAAPTR